MSKVPASKVYGLIDELNAISNEDSIDELKLRRIFNQAQELNELEDRYMITGIYYCLMGNAAEAFLNLDTAFRIDSKGVFDAYIKTALRLNLENKAYKKALCLTESPCSASISLYGIRVLINCGDFLSAKKAIEIYERAYSNQDEIITSLLTNPHFKVDAIKELANMDFDYKYLSLITRNLMDYAFNSFDLVVTDKTVEIVNDDVTVISNTLNFANATEDQLESLNDYVLEQLIEYESSTETHRFVFHLLDKCQSSQKEYMVS
jgi:tetratricopeptide (TPR) repeat protein